MSGDRSYFASSQHKPVAMALYHGFASFIVHANCSKTVPFETYHLKAKGLAFDRKRAGSSNDQRQPLVPIQCSRYIICWMYEFYGSQETPVVIFKCIGTIQRQKDILSRLLQHYLLWHRMAHL